MYAWNTLPLLAEYFFPDHNIFEFRSMCFDDNGFSMEVFRMNSRTHVCLDHTLLLA